MYALLPLLLVTAQAPSEVPKWVPKFVGVEQAEQTVTTPRPLKAYALKIDLTADGVSFLATPRGTKPGYTLGLKTSTFLTQHKAQAAINGAPYQGPHDIEGRDEEIVGLQISRGTIVSAAAKSSAPAVILDKDNSAKIAKPPFAAEGVYNAVGGFFLVLENGKVLATNADKHPRTAVGLSADGKTMIWLVVDGRQPGISEGVTAGELGGWLKALGASDGINLDGGGTSTMVIADADGKAKVLNQPVHTGKPGTERVCGSHLALFAKPLPK